MLCGRTFRAKDQQAKQVPCSGQAYPDHAPTGRANQPIRTAEILPALLGDEPFPHVATHRLTRVVGRQRARAYWVNYCCRPLKELVAKRVFHRRPSTTLALKNTLAS